MIFGQQSSQSQNLMYNWTDYYTINSPSVNSTMTNQQIEENSQMEKGEKLELRTEVLLKILLAILVFKSIAFTIFLFVLVIIIPPLNPNYQ